MFDATKICGAKTAFGRLGEAGEFQVAGIFPSRLSPDWTVLLCPPFGPPTTHRRDGGQGERFTVTLPPSPESRFMNRPTGSMMILLIATAMPAVAEPPKFLSRMFNKSAKPIETAANGRALAVEDGPWMILAHTFVGPNSQEKAERLAGELSSSMNLPTFVYKEKFDFTDGPKAKPHETRRVRYANPYEYEAYAVLVGEYDDLEHPNAEKHLRQIKSATPAIFSDQQVMAEETNLMNPVTAIKAVHQKLLESRDNEAGPMSTAFMTRNPMLPPEYFQSPRVDSFVESLNKDMPHSLLQCEAKYTVVVRTFQGFGLIANGKFEQNFTPSPERLDKCAIDAGKMVTELRKQGVQAFQFHDRDKSIVTIGGFDNLGRELPDGTFEYAREIRQVMDKYRAFNVSEDVNRQLAQSGKLKQNNQTAANHVANIPFDVQPVPIAVPKPSKRSLYSRAFSR
ncbi:hypothetical protein V7x_41770 [Crateriforma conspicua]|uniref:Uncharacterized protein n=2 Tax=Planctomycetaceae TaxID=126 RepID=A0A5C6FMR0_9PLAN|nr:hypothetical protein V7x_41770 [Crateriforma conspicua]